MYAVIYQLPERPGVGLLPVAGRPLIARQIQWLCSMGCQEIFVEIDTHEASGRLAEWLGSADGVGVFIDLTLTAKPSGPEEVARRSGIPRGMPYLAIPADVLGSGDLTRLYHHAEHGGVLARLSPDRTLPASLEAAEVRLFGRGDGPPESMDIGGWGARIGTMQDALSVGVALLTAPPGAEGFEFPIHATQTEPGVWVARGARIGEGARLVAPVLIGVDCYVGRGARVGPRACIGDRAFIEANAVVEGTQVQSDCVVLEELPASNCTVTHRGLNSLGSGALKQPLGISLGPSHPPPQPTPPSSRLIAALFLLALLPFALPVLLGRALLRRPVSERRTLGHRSIRCGTTGFGPADRLIALLGVVNGERTLLGVRDELKVPPGATAALVEQALAAPCGAISVEPALTAFADDSLARLRSRAWYSEAKCRSLDTKILLELARARPASLQDPTQLTTTLPPTRLA